MVEIMNRGVSTYLDLLRVSAAFVVLLGHFAHERFSSDALSFIRGYEHDAVIIFFVLSGYVITSAVNQKNYSAFEYFTARLGRIYSVLFPAIVLTLFVDQVGTAINSGLYDGVYQDSYPLLRVVSAVTFLNESILGPIRFFSNGPMWSISYEFFYYIFFGIALYVKNNNRTLLLFLVAILAGPRILLLLPVWYLGCYLHNLEKLYELKPSFWGIFFVLSVVAYALYVICLKEHIPKFDLGYSSHFLSDYIVSIFIGVNILSFSKLSSNISIQKGWLTGMIKKASGYTFSLYLYHFPLLLMYASLINHEPSDNSSRLILFSITLITIVILAKFTEHKKTFFNAQVRRLLAYLLRSRQACVETKNN